MFDDIYLPQYKDEVAKLRRQYEESDLESGKANSPIAVGEKMPSVEQHKARIKNRSAVNKEVNAKQDKIFKRLSDMLRVQDLMQHEEITFDKAEKLSKR